MLGLMIGLAGVIAYWPTLAALVEIWIRDPDYSHGFFIIPSAVCFLWMRRKTFPGLQEVSPGVVLSLLLISMAMRYVGGRFYYLCLEGWSLLAWAAAVAALLGGRRLLWWASPSICFLLFMIPLPHAWEGQFAYPLQRIATMASTWMLQLLGQTAFADGTIILLEQQRLQVASACCGLRMLVTTFALVFALIVVVDRPWSERLCLVVAAVPVALAANVARIVLLGLSCNASVSEGIRPCLHDFAGMGAMIVAAGLLWLMLWYLKHLFPADDSYDAAGLIREVKMESGH